MLRVPTTRGAPVWGGTCTTGGGVADGDSGGVGVPCCGKFPRIPVRSTYGMWRLKYHPYLALPGAIFPKMAST